MSDIKISLCCAAVRTNKWEKFYNSLKGNKIGWEVVFVGNKKPEFNLPENFRWIDSPTKPTQCYEIAFREAKGELISWTADDSYYDHIKPNNLDVIYDFFKKENNKKLIAGFRPIEDRHDVWNNHHFFGKWHNTPLMAPFAAMDKEYFHQLGGYDNRFISGQAENDVVMRVYENGGDCKICMDAYVYVDHQGVHSTDQGVHRGYVNFYHPDRRFLESCWIPSGYGAYKNYQEGNKGVEISKKRLQPVISFVDAKIKEESQGYKGTWI